MFGVWCGKPSGLCLHFVAVQSSCHIWYCTVEVFCPFAVVFPIYLLVSSICCWIVQGDCVADLPKLFGPIWGRLPLATSPNLGGLYGFLHGCSFYNLFLVLWLGFSSAEAQVFSSLLGSVLNGNIWLQTSIYFLSSVCKMLVTFHYLNPASWIWPIARGHRSLLLRFTLHGRSISCHLR